MKNSTKIWLALSGILLIALGVVFICQPTKTIFTTAWLIGCFTLIAGISKMVFTFRTQAFLPNSGSRMLSAAFEIIMGCIFLSNKMFVAISLPLMFSLWVIFEGVIVAVQSFDYKKFGFGGWWLLLLLGIAGVVLGFKCLQNPRLSAVSLSTFMGISVIVYGASYLFALSGVKKLERFIEGR